MLVRNGTEEHALHDYSGAPPPVGAAVEGRRQAGSRRPAPRSPLGLDERVCIHIGSGSG
jgi:hypothetical protein